MKTIRKRRRRENKTDYKQRMNLLKSGLDRIVIRKTNRYILIQLVGSAEAQDYVKKTITSRELLKKGWPEKHAGSLKSLPAAYLTGLLLGKQLKGQKAILDAGMTKNIKGSRIYAALKGLIDSGVKINANKEVFPSDKRLNGEHMKEDLRKVIKKLMEELKK